ncbi:MAG: GNAT family N-acetyltransferase [Candidatus Rokubacteria bacterium]|nr:GNAT family N-acetyltransferase [Candidatus Rokubacteria bacterium]
MRRFVEDDVPQVADLHRRVFRTAAPTTAGWMEAYRQYFSEVFLNNPPGDGALTSLVCEEGPGKIVGFLGLMPRRMVFDGRPVLMAVCSQFAVDPGSRGQAGLRMLKRCLEGPQDLSITDEAGDSTRKIWEWCGGATALPYSIDWIRPLRPARLAVTVLARRKALAPLARASVPVAWVVDALATGLAGSPFRLSPPRGSREDLDEAMLFARLPEFAADRSLRPDYDDRSVKWLLERAAELKGHGRLRKVLVRDEEREIAGWYLYHVDRDGLGEVVQIAARAHAVHRVLDHLWEDAARQGAIALSGRLEPAFAQELSERCCLFYRRGRWTLIHSKKPELLHAIQRGDAFLTRLEGEWCLRFR